MTTRGTGWRCNVCRVSGSGEGRNRWRCGQSECDWDACGECMKEPLASWLSVRKRDDIETKKIKIGDEITEVEANGKIVDVTRCSLEEAAALFAINGLPGTTEMKICFYRAPSSDATLPMELLQSVYKSKPVLVGIFKSYVDVKKTTDAYMAGGSVTVTCDPERKDEQVDAAIIVGKDASRFLLHPQAGSDLNWFAAFSVAKDGKVHLIGHTISKPTFRNKQPFSQLITSADLDDVVLMQDEKANSSLLPAIMLNHDSKNKTAKYQSKCGHPGCKAAADISFV